MYRVLQREDFQCVLSKKSLDHTVLNMIHIKANFTCLYWKEYKFKILIHYLCTIHYNIDHLENIWKK